MTRWLSILIVTTCSLSLRADDRPTTAQANDSSRPTVEQCMDDAWKVTWQRFYLRRTNLFYDYLSSYQPGAELAHLPTGSEVQRQVPNECGYGTGMEDCMISAGVMLSLIVDRYEITKDAALIENAQAVVNGILTCATVHGEAGFVARAVCVEDGKSVYPNSSRDQYTHAVHGLWLYANSSLCNPKSKQQVADVLSAIADRMTRNVTAKNDYDSLRVDGSRDTRGISRMWNVKGHEAARLPMIYAAAWDITGKQKYFDLYRKYLPKAVKQSHDVETWQATYALLQMQISLELLCSLEQDAELKREMHQIMEMVSQLCATRAIQADKVAAQLDLTMVCSNWRTGDGLSEKGKYRKVWYNIRESGEAALAQLVAPNSALPRPTFSGEQQARLETAIRRIDYHRVSSCGIFYLQAAYWKSRRNVLEIQP